MFSQEAENAGMIFRVAMVQVMTDQSRQFEQLRYRVAGQEQAQAYKQDQCLSERIHGGKGRITHWKKVYFCAFKNHLHEMDHP